MAGPVPSPELSVVIPTYRQPRLLTEALASLALQEFDPEGVEIIVVDDGTPGFDPRSLDGHAGPFAVQWVCHERNLGRARARNSGIRAGRAPVIVFLDGDMTVAPGFFEAHARFHRAHPGEVGIGDIRFGAEVPTTALTRYIEGRGVRAYSPGQAVPYKCFVTGNSSISRQLLEAVGLFDESFSAYGGEDLELGYRLHCHGTTFRFAAEPLSYHRHLRSLGESCELMVTYGRRSIPLLVTRHPELVGLLHLDFLDRPWHPRSVMLRVALWSFLCQRMLRWAESRLDRRVPGVVFSYLWWCHRTQGLLASRAADEAVDPATPGQA
ncbi:glycosyltransferase family 2 protein [Candidatus Latescibacterota bacterium]